MIEKAISGAIFSFHMPLFFILSGITYKCSTNFCQFWEKTKKSFRHLVVPAIIIYFLKIVIEVIYHHSAFDVAGYYKTFIGEKLLTLLFFSGAKFTVAEKEIAMIGMLWFLMVLFLGRTLYDFLHMKMRGKLLMAVCATLSIVGVILGKIQWLPLSFDIVPAVMPFFFIGNCMKTINVKDKALLKMACCFVVWVILLTITYFSGSSFFSLASRHYSNYPISYIIAVAGTMMVAEVSVLCMYLGKIVRPILFLGKNSMYMLFVHYMDYLWEPLWNAGDNAIVTVIVRIISDIVVFMAVLWIVYGVRKLKARQNGSTGRIKK